VRIQAAFGGNAEDYGSVSQAYIQVVNRAGTATTLTTTRAQIRGTGRQVLLAAVDAVGATGIIPVGRVVFRRNGRVIGRAQLIGATAMLVLPRRIPARGTFIASFQGNPRFGPSTSAPLILSA
jgi:hypothetical protein